MADCAAPGAVKEEAWRVERLGDGEITAIGTASELVGAGSVDASAVATALCEGTAASLFASSP
jgi:hypothetical protein